MQSEIADNAVLYLYSKVIPEPGVLLAVVGLQLFQLRFYFFLNVGRDDLQLTIMLQHFTRYVERHVVGVDNAFNKAEMIGQQLLAPFHNKDAA